MSGHKIKPFITKLSKADRQETSELVNAYTEEEPEEKIDIQVVKEAVREYIKQKGKNVATKILDKFGIKTVRGLYQLTNLQLKELHILVFLPEMLETATVQINNVEVPIVPNSLSFSEGQGKPQFIRVTTESKGDVTVEGPGLMDFSKANNPPDPEEEDEEVNPT